MLINIKFAAINHIVIYSSKILKKENVILVDVETSNFATISSQ